MSVKYTTETFNQKLIEKGRIDLELLGEYGKNAKDKVQFKCKICGNEWFAFPSDILAGRKCPVCTRVQSAIKRSKTNEQFLKEVAEKGNPNIEILEPYKNSSHFIKVRCKKNLSHVWNMKPQVILEGGGCPYCSHKKISVDGSNSLAVDRPDLLQYFLNEADAFKYSTYSNKKLYFKCPNCGKTKTKKMIIGNLSKRGFSCEFCGDNISKPNKFIREVARQLLEIKEIDDYQLEYSPEWAGNFRYDCYIKKDNLNILIEMDGEQHKMDKGFYSNGVKERDQIKNQLAKENNYTLIRIDCEDTSYSNLKKMLLDKINLFNLNKINWEKVKESLQINLMKQICEEYKKHEHIFLKEMSDAFHLDKGTIVKILKEGTKLGLCDYNSKKQYLESMRITNSLKVDIYDLNDNLIITLNSVKDANEWCKKTFNRCSHDYISQCLNGKRSSYKNYIFKYHNPQTTKQNNQK